MIRALPEATWSRRTSSPSRSFPKHVILSRTAFDRLPRNERRMPAAGGSPHDAGRAAVPRKTGIESFGPLPRGTLFETPWNLVDAETAAFFMEDVIPVRPHLKGRIESGPAEAESGGDGG
jgi:hypothetical protein